VSVGDALRNIGVSNFNVQSLYDLLSYGQITPAVNQIELHPYLVQDELVSFCERQGIHVTAFSPFGGESYVVFGVPALGKAEPLMRHEAVLAIAHAHSCTPGQVLLAFALARGCSVIPKSVSAERMAENLAAVNVHLTDEEVVQLKALDRHLRYNDVTHVWGCPIGY
jgi:diketogulonate reductase-like aldo/keto reductase